MRGLVWIATLLALAGQAQALSCMRTDAISTFEDLAAAPEAYFVLHGVLTFDESGLPPFVQQDPVSDPAPLQAQFTGKGLTAQGFSKDYTGPVTLQITCAGPWCGRVQSGQDAIVFVPADDPALTVTAGPCGGRLFYDPTPETLAMLTACMQGGVCSAE
ncbi:hypothetical protein [Yoonia vestfoldensis]|uniref:hypothetical protein n=1 Tax=Yoonia vestfoldensis TaxID=245188 RepID=UPI000370DD1D|nr:hypothetical protein [Yoonia vestfoldensis]